jgi:hypothetical protein
MRKKSNTQQLGLNLHKIGRIYRPTITNEMSTNMKKAKYWKYKKNEKGRI